MELIKNVFFNTDKLIEKDNVKISYLGELFQNGSEEVTLHLGYGDDWKNSQDIKMEKSDFGFQCKIDGLGAKTLNFCFKNEKNQWDNNGGQNYSYPIEKATQELTSTDVIAEDTPIKLDLTEDNIDAIESIRESKIEENKDQLLHALDELFLDIDEPSDNEIPLNKLDSVSSISNEVVDDYVKSVNEPKKVEEKVEENVEEKSTALVAQEKGFLDLNRSVSRSYLFKKKVKLALYKLFVYVPRLIFGENFKEDTNEVDDK